MTEGVGATWATSHSKLHPLAPKRQRFVNDGPGSASEPVPSNPPGERRAGAIGPASDLLRQLVAVDVLKRITLHECRHTFASLMIAAGVNAKALSTYMGHANIAITLDRYGHLMPGNEEEAASLLDAYLERADTKARIAQVA